MIKRTHARVGEFGRIPYDWRRPTKDRFLARVWNPNAPFLTPKWWGWGYDFNLYGIFHPITYYHNGHKRKAQ